MPKYARPYKFKMSILVNAKTASACEILAGALQDHDRATIVGEPSYGKGLVQTVQPLSNGAGLAITTAFYYTPSGRSIQHPLQNSALSDTFQQVADRDRPRYLTDHGRTVLRRRRHPARRHRPALHARPAGRSYRQQRIRDKLCDTVFAIAHAAPSALRSHPRDHRRV